MVQKSGLKYLKQPKSLDPSLNIKLGFFSAVIGSVSYLFIIQFLLILQNKLLYTDIELIQQFQIDPEFFVYGNLLFLILAPVVLIDNSLGGMINLILLDLPWIFSGFVTGIIFGPKNNRGILYGSIIPILIVGFGFGSILLSLMVISSLLMGISGFSFSIFVILLILGFGLFLGIGVVISLLFIYFPMRFGYSVGAKFNSKTYPQIIMAKPEINISDEKITLGTSKSGFSQKKQILTCMFYKKRIFDEIGYCSLTFEGELSHSVNCVIFEQFQECQRYQQYLEGKKTKAR